MSTSQHIQLSNINSDQLHNLLESKQHNILVIDVRDDDYIGGNIKNAVNIPSHRFNYRLQHIVDDYIVNSNIQPFDYIVLHCMKSQVRGPKAARQLVAHINMLIDTNKIDINNSSNKLPTIAVLHEGAESFIRYIATHPDIKDKTLYIDNYDKEYWGYNI